MNKIICSNCGNNHTSNPIAGGLGTVFCFDCSTETEVKTGKKVFASRIHPTNPYNFSEDELFLILSLGSIILEVAEKPKKIDKIYEYLKWRDPNTKEGIGLEKEKIKIIKKRLKEGYSVAIEISKKMTEDEGSNLFNILFQILINQKDVTINETAALVEICRLTEGNWQSFMVFLSENSPFKIAEIGPAMKNINIPILAHGGCGDPKDVLELAQNTNVSGAVIASFFHYNSISRFKKFVSKVGNTDFLDNLSGIKKNFNLIKKIKSTLKLKGFNVR